MPDQAHDLEPVSKDQPAAIGPAADPPWSWHGRAGVVIAGAGARGAYEAGVLSILLPSLFEDLSDVLLLGTSAGAVNAALWAQYATPGRSLEKVGDDVCDFWRKLDVSRVYDPILWGLLKRVVGFSWIFGRVSSLLDTGPLTKHCAKTLDRKQLAENIAKGSLAGVGLVATTCPADGTGGRSHVFLQARGDIPRPKPDLTSALDYLDVEIAHQHVLASAAIPIAFPPVGVPGTSGGVGYYTDGGVRLNTPISPALDLDAKRLVIVSSHATDYPKANCFNEKPDVIDIAAQSVHSILADGMIEDLRTLRRINSMVRQSPTPLWDESARPRRHFREVPLIAVAPRPGQLAQLAHDFRAKFSFSPKRAYRKFEYGFVRSVFAGFGTGVGNDELLSYLLFNPQFAQEQITLGKQHAREELRKKGIAIREKPSLLARIFG